MLTILEIVLFLIIINVVAYVVIKNIRGELGNGFHSCTKEAEESKKQIEKTKGKPTRRFE
jgi:uncharacterized protein (UPF0333 family)